MANIAQVVKEINKLNFQPTIRSCLNQKDSVCTTFENNKHLIRVLQIPTEKRTKNHIRLIKSVLKSLKTFNYSQIGVNQFARKQDQDLIETISYFVGTRIAKKGQLLDITGKKKKAVQILLSGCVSIFQPTNSMSLKESITMYSQQIIQQGIQNILSQDYQQIYSDAPQLSNDQIMDLLIKNRVFSKFTNPHKFVASLREGSLICESNWYKKINQQRLNNFYSVLNLPSTQKMISVCASNCLILEFSLSILQKSNELLSYYSGVIPEHRPYIFSLVKSFKQIKQLPYQFITEYVRSQWIIDNSQKHYIKPSQYFYHIVQGQVLIQQQTNQKLMTRNDKAQHKSNNVQCKIRRGLISLHTGDFFGFQPQIFPKKRFLYLIEPNSKILKLAKLMYSIHNKDLYQFFDQLQSQRRTVLSRIINQPQYFLKKEEFKQKKKEDGFQKIIKSSQKDKQQEMKTYETFRSLVLHRKKSEMKLISPSRKQIINPEEIQESLLFISRQMLRGSTDIKVQDRQIKVLNKRGDLKRKIIIPEGQNQRTTYRRIGLLDIREVQTSNKIAVNHRIKMLGDPIKRGNINQAFTGQRNLPNFPQLSKKQQKVLKVKSMSLPKIEYLAKNEDRIFKTRMHKL